MAILAECPACRRKQSLRNKKCKCGENLDKAKKSERVRYWISYRLPGGRQRREPADGKTLDDARASEGKRRAQKKEGRILDMLPASKTTFSELVEWYKELRAVKSLASYNRILQALNNFTAAFGTTIINNLSLADLENYQADREGQGASPATIDMEIAITKTMLNKAVDNDKINADAMKAFRKIKRRLRKGSNARRRTLSIEEYLNITKTATPHMRAMIIVAFNTGMRLGELRNLKWSNIDMQKGFIRLGAGATKEDAEKIVPINAHARKALQTLPRAIRNDFVFTHGGEPITSPGGIRRSFETACTRAKITKGRDVPGGLVFHDIRRTVKTLMASAGVDKVYRDVILGHSLKGMDVHYIVPTEEDLTRAMATYTAFVGREIEKLVNKWSTEAGK